MVVSARFNRGAVRVFTQNTLDRKHLVIGFRLLVFPLTGVLTLAPSFGLEFRAIDCTGLKRHPTVLTNVFQVCKKRRKKTALNLKTN